MFEGQPKGLYALALANTGERFGYYTMLAIFTLFLQAKFGFTAATTSTIFASFLAGVYFMPLIGGILADKFGYGKMVTTGIVIMFAGYVLLAIPMATNIGLYSMFGALALIALGTGLFKGNLQVMVGNLYDAPEYSAKRDTIPPAPQTSQAPPPSVRSTYLRELRREWNKKNARYYDPLNHHLPCQIQYLQPEPVPRSHR